MSTPLRQKVSFPPGRLVFGHPTRKIDKDRKGRLLLTKDGKPRAEWSFGCAIEKKGTQAFWQTEWGAIFYGIVRAAFPHRFDAAGQPVGKLSFKVIDGDSAVPNDNGNKPCDQEGYPGNWIVVFKTSLQPPALYKKENGQYLPFDETMLKTGYYVQVAGSVDSNGDTDKPGCYVNPDMVLFLGYGPEIVSEGRDPNDVFNTAHQMPAGMSATPVGGLPAAAPAAAQVPPPVATPGLPPVGSYGPPPAAVAPPTVVTPHPAVMQPPGAAAAPAVPAAPAAIQVTAKAGAGVTWEMLQKANWTEALARQHGMII